MPADERFQAACRSLLRGAFRRFAARLVSARDYPATPDGRYFVVRGRLWRKSNPALDPDRREALVRELMGGRRAVRDARGDPEKLAQARAAVDVAKVALGERGDPWWTDGAPDFNRKMARSTPYAAWFDEVTAI